jgi:hypothetical protein
VKRVFATMLVLTLLLFAASAVFAVGERGYPLRL